MVLKKKDFVEIKFTGRIKDTGEIFDSNIKEDLEKIGSKTKAKPFISCLGEDMFLKEIDNFLIGKNIGEHTIELTPEKAFGKRNPKLIQMIPMRVFRQNNTNPVPGAMFNFDGRIGKILTVSGGRVMADFNNPLAGKDVVYNIKVLKKVEKLEEQIKAIIEFLFKRELEFEVKDKKLIIKVEKQTKPYVEMFKDKFKNIFGLELEVKGKENKQKAKKENSFQKKE